MATTQRVQIDCRRFPSESNCSLTISGTEEEVLKAAREHAVSAHGHKNTEELVTTLRGSLEPARS